MFNSDQLRDLRDRRPFKPFAIIVRSGERFGVPKADYLFVPPVKADWFRIATGDGGSMRIALSHIADIVFSSPARKRRSA